MKSDYVYMWKKSRPSRKKKSPPSLPWRKIIVFVILLVGFITFFTGPRSVIHLYLLYGQREKLQQQKQILLKENQQLKQELHRLKTDTQYMLRIAREKFNLKKKNEKIIIVQPQ